jgi:DNA-binding beta-propeller fold protein YncE
MVDETECASGQPPQTPGRRKEIPMLKPSLQLCLLVCGALIAQDSIAQGEIASAFIANRDGDTVSVVPIPLRDPPIIKVIAVNETPFGAEVSEDLGRIYITSRGEDDGQFQPIGVHSLEVLGFATGGFIGRLGALAVNPKARFVCGISASEPIVWITSEGPGGRFLVSASSSTGGSGGCVKDLGPIPSIDPSDHTLVGLAVTSTSKIYISDKEENVVHLYDAENDVISDLDPVVPNARFGRMTLSPDERRLYVLEEGSVGSVSVYSTVSNVLVCRIGLDPFPFDLALSPTGDELYVSHGSGQLTLLEVEDLSVCTDTALRRRVLNLTSGGFGLGGVSVTPGGTAAFVTDPENNEVLVIELLGDIFDPSNELNVITVSDPSFDFPVSAGSFIAPTTGLGFPAIPTLGEYGLSVLMLLLLGVGLIMARRKRQ